MRQGELVEGFTCSFVLPSLFHALRGSFDLQHQASPAHDPFAHALVSRNPSPTPPDALQAATDGDFLDSDLEFQIRSQVQMLYAVFQAHSTAEDEVIWPALRAKTACGGSGVGELVYEEADVLHEHEYTEDHADEDRLFRNLQQVLTRLSCVRSNSTERLNLLAELESITTTVGETFVAHLVREEKSAMPLIQKVFTSAELQKLVGDIMGKRPAELMRKIFYQ